MAEFRSGNPPPDRTAALAGTLRHGAAQPPEIITPLAVATVHDIAPGMVFATEIERFLILRELGIGGTARTFVALPIRTAQFAGTVFPHLPAMSGSGVYPMLPDGHRLLHEYERLRPVCLKVFLMQPNDPFYTAFVERLRQEAAFLGQIGGKQFPLLVAGDERPIPWIAIEFIRGETLADLTARYHELDPPRRMEWRRAMAIIAKLAAALDVLHEVRIVHRDLKPPNVVMEHPVGTPGLADATFDDEYPRIIDLGIGKALERSPRPGDTGSVIVDRHITRFTPNLAMLTPGYGAPEQVIADAEITAAADIFALGAIAYELLAGELPFAASDDALQYLDAVRRPITPIRHPKLSADACEQITYVLARALAFHATERYQRALDFADALRAILEVEERRTRPRDSAPTAANPRTPVHATLARRTPALQIARRTPPPRTNIFRRIVDEVARLFE